MRSRFNRSFIVFLLLIFPLFAASVSIPSISAYPDGTVAIPINIDDATGVAGFNFNIDYDFSVLQAESITRGDLIPGWMLTPNISVPGQITVAGVDSSLSGLPGGSGSLVVMHFNIVGDVGDTSQIEFTGNNKIDNAEGQTLPSTFHNGSLSVQTDVPSITLPFLTESQGSTVDVSVEIDDASGVAGFNLNITFDPSVIQAQSVARGTLISGWMITPNTSIAGQVTVAGVTDDIQGGGLAGGSGSLAVISFEVVGSPGDSTALAFTGNNKIDNAEGQTISSSFQNGSLSVDTSGLEMSVVPDSLNFTFDLSQPDVPFQKNANADISNTGTEGTLNWSVGSIQYHRGSNWVTVLPDEGSLVAGNSQETTVTVDRTNLAFGIYTATIEILSNAGNAEIAVSVEITTDDKLVSIPDTSASPGNTVRIPVNIDNADGVAGYQFTITYDPSVLQATGVEAGSLTQNWMMEVNNGVPGEIIVGGLNNSPEALPEISGSIIEMHFNLAGQPGQSTELTFTEMVLITPSPGASEIPAQFSPGIFSIGGYEISGTVSLEGGSSSVTEVLLTLSGTASASTSPDAGGNYSFTNVMPGSYTVAPLLNGYRFEPLQTDYPDLDGHSSSQDYAGVRQCVLTVVSTQGSPLPSVGENTYDFGTAVNAIVESPADEVNGTRHICTGWTGTGDVPDSGTATAVSFNITQASSLQWNWQEQHQLTVNVQGSGNVEVNPSSVENWYDAGTSVTLTAEPEDGWFFSHWEGGAAGTQNSKEIVMNSPNNITARFAKKGFSLQPEHDLVSFILDGSTAYDTLLAVGVQYIGGFEETIDISYSLNPAADKITVDILPYTISSPGDLFLLDIGLSGDVAASTYILTVKGESGDITETADIVLVVNTKIYIPLLTEEPTALYVDIPVKTTAATGITEFVFTLLYDPELLDMTEPAITAGTLNPSGWTLNVNSPFPGQLDVNGFGPEPLASEGGSLAIISANILDSSIFPLEGISLDMQDVLLLTVTGVPIPNISEEGRLFLMIAGDITADNVVNIRDVMLSLRMSLDMEVEVKGQMYQHPYPGWLVLRADMTGDGVVNVSDVILSLRKSVGLD